MDKEYAELSLKIGIVAGAADSYLGGGTFLARARKHRWNLTPAMLRDWKQEAVDLGVPAENMDLAAGVAAGN